jgi:hypothetical protein
MSVTDLGVDLDIGVGTETQVVLEDADTSVKSIIPGGGTASRLEIIRTKVSPEIAARYEKSWASLEYAHKDPAEQ